MDNESLKELQKLYPSIEYVDTAFIVQDESDRSFDVRLYDEIIKSPDEDYEKCGFGTWDDAQDYIESLYDEHPEIYFNRLYDLDRFCEEDGAVLKERGC